VYSARGAAASRNLTTIGKYTNLRKFFNIAIERFHLFQSNILVTKDFVLCSITDSDPGSPKVIILFTVVTDIS
jgi:hypothetical protein